MIDMQVDVNGEPQQWQVAPGETLLEALRRHHFKGPKLVCGTGDCCACTVVLADKSVCACCLPALKADGQHVMTVEGLAERRILHPLQTAFTDARRLNAAFARRAF